MSLKGLAGKVFKAGKAVAPFLGPEAMIAVAGVDLGSKVLHHGDDHAKAAPQTAAAPVEQKLPFSDVTTNELDGPASTPAVATSPDLPDMG